MWPRPSSRTEHLRRRRAGLAAMASERRDAQPRASSGHAVRPRRHEQLLQARKLPERRPAATLWRPRRLQLLRRREQQLGVAGLRRGKILQRRHLGRPDPGARADQPPELRAERKGITSSITPPNVCGLWVRFHCGSSTRGGAPILDPEGNPDTSFLAKIPADTPFTFQMIDRNGLVLDDGADMAPGAARRSAHRLRRVPLTQPVSALVRAHGGGTSRVQTSRPDEGGVAAHSLRRDTSRRPEASRAGPWTSSSTATSAPSSSAVASVATAGSKTPVPGNLVLDDEAIYGDLPFSLGRSVPGDYARLALDRGGRWGYRPLARGWLQTNASRYVRMFQSRRSLLVWKIFGRRLDGWSNADHPTEAVPGDPSTLPKGAYPRDADLDYTGTIMPPPDSGVPPLTPEERLTIARWIDLGSPIDLGRDNRRPGVGWFLDETRPTLTVSSPASEPQQWSAYRDPHRVGGCVYGSGPAKPVGHGRRVSRGRRPGTDLARLGALVGDGIFSIPFTPPLDRLEQGRLTVKIKDKQGNLTVKTVRFSVGDVRPGPHRPLTSMSVTPPWQCSLGPTLHQSVAARLDPKAGSRRTVPSVSRRSSVYRFSTRHRPAAPIFSASSGSRSSRSTLSQSSSGAFGRDRAVPSRRGRRPRAFR